MAMRYNLAMIHIKRLFALLAFCSSLAFAQVLTVIPLPDITGSGAIVPFSSTIVGGVATWVEVVCTGTGTARLGSTTTAPAANVGVPCAAGGTQFYPSVLLSPGVFRKYDLSTLLGLIPTGMSLSITYAK